MSTSSESTRSVSAARSIALIARREIDTRIRTKSFVVTNVLLLVVIVGGLIVLSAVRGDDGPSILKVGVVGGDAALSQTITASGGATGDRVQVTPVADARVARAQVDDDTLDVAVVPTPAGAPTAYTAVTKDGLTGSASTVVRTALAQDRLRRALRQRGVDPAAITPAAQQFSTLDVVQTDSDDPDEGQRIVIATVGVVLLLVAILQGGGMIAVGVVEEKTSRVVELLLAAIKPLHLLWGKIIGIGAMLLAQVVLLGAAGLITGSATGLLTIPGAAVSMFVAVIVWFVLGFLFFATLYAAGGAMVSRQEETNSATMPLTFLGLAVLYAAVFGINAITSPFISTLSWIPPFSASLMPMRIATGDTDVVQVVGTLVIMIAACLGAVWVASRIYQRSILRTGARVRWSEALRGTPESRTSTTAPRT